MIVQLLKTNREINKSFTSRNKRMFKTTLWQRDECFQILTKLSIVANSTPNFVKQK